MKKLVLAVVAIAVLMSAASAVMALGGQPSDELDALQARVARLEAKEEVLSAFNQYLYGIDTGLGEDILDTFAEDAILDVPNFPLTTRTCTSKVATTSRRSMPCTALARRTSAEVTTRRTSRSTYALT